MNNNYSRLIHINKTYFLSIIVKKYCKIIRSSDNRYYDWYYDWSHVLSALLIVWILYRILITVLLNFSKKRNYLPIL